MQATDLPSYSEAAASPNSLASSPSLDYTDFTISDLRAQIIANAMILRPSFKTDKTRADYEVELVLAKREDQHYALIVRRNVGRTDKDRHNNKALLKSNMATTPRRALEDILGRTEAIIQKMVERRDIECVSQTNVEGIYYW